MITLTLPPFTQLNTPYPAISYLAAHLKAHHIACTQRDLGIELALKIYSKPGLKAIFDLAEAQNETAEWPEPAWRMLSLRRQYEKSIDSIVSFLQGKDRTLAHKAALSDFLPMGPRTAAADLSQFGPMGLDDSARLLCSLVLEDIADFITEVIDPGFGFVRYQPQLATGPVSFDPIADRMEQTTIIDEWLDDLVDGIQSEIVCISIPFPGALYGALRMGKRLKESGKTVWMGGGYVNTELRHPPDPRLFDCCDALSYDDGEGPILELIKRHRGQNCKPHRTRTKEGASNMDQSGKGFVCGADYGDLDLSLYLQIVDQANPTHRLWSDGRWNKITLAHGCYWKRCAFCDISLDYISRYEDAEIEKLVDTMENQLKNTGIRGFHFVDEAAPPKALKALSLEILKRDLSVSFWGNIRFEKSYTPDLCRLLAAAGLIGVSGGLEVANDRLLKLMDKGITVDQAARSAKAFMDAGVMVHAYLIYGFPTQTDQETLIAMENVRQLFEAGCLSSAFWHRFVLTRHSGVFQDPARYSIEIPPLKPSLFASNDIPHIDPKGGDHDQFDSPLPQSMKAWMSGQDLDVPVWRWFPHKMPKVKVPKDRIQRALAEQSKGIKGNQRLIWLGGEPLCGETELILHSNSAASDIPMNETEMDWAMAVIEQANPQAPVFKVADAKAAFSGSKKRFETLWSELNAAGLVAV